MRKWLSALIFGPEPKPLPTFAVREPREFAGRRRSDQTDERYISDDAAFELTRNSSQAQREARHLELREELVESVRQPVFQPGERPILAVGDGINILYEKPSEAARFSALAAANFAHAADRSHSELNKIVRESVGSHGDMRIPRVVDPTDTGALSAAMNGK